MKTNILMSDWEIQMTEKEEDYVAQVLAPLVSSPTLIERMGDDLKDMNPKFNRDKWVDRAIKAWEETNLPRLYYESGNAH
jgi:hypothetical protein